MSAQLSAAEGRTQILASRRGTAVFAGAQELAMLLPALALVGIFLILPFALSCWISLTNQRLIPRPVPVKFVGLDNFARILSDPEFWNALLNVTEFTVLVVPVQCGLALALAILLNGRLPFRNLFRGLFFLPAITSMVVVCVVWSTLFQYPTGPFNQILHALTFGLVAPVDWLGNTTTAMPAIVLLSAWQAYGFQMVVYLAGLQQIDPTIYEAARMDGASAWRRFWHVTMPGLRQTHVFALIITTIQAFKLFTQVNILTQGGPRGATDMVVHYMFTAGFVDQKVGIASAVSIVLFVFVLTISVIQRYAVRERA